MEWLSELGLIACTYQMNRMMLYHHSIHTSLDPLVMCELHKPVSAMFDCKFFKLS